MLKHPIKVQYPIKRVTQITLRCSPSFRFDRMIIIRDCYGSFAWKFVGLERTLLVGDSESQAGLIGRAINLGAIDTVYFNDVKLYNYQIVRVAGSFNLNGHFYWGTIEYTCSVDTNIINEPVRNCLRHEIPKMKTVYDAWFEDQGCE